MRPVQCVACRGGLPHGSARILATVAAGSGFLPGLRVLSRNSPSTPCSARLAPPRRPAKPAARGGRPARPPPLPPPPGGPSPACAAQQGRPQEAVALLAPILGWFTEGFDTADLKEAKTLLDKLTEPAIAAEG